jgi:hypothetical protein
MPAVSPLTLTAAPRGRPGLVAWVSPLREHGGVGIVGRYGRRRRTLLAAGCCCCDVSSCLPFQAWKVGAAALQSPIIMQWKPRDCIYEYYYNSNDRPPIMYTYSTYYYKK